MGAGNWSSAKIVDMPMLREINLKEFYADARFWGIWLAVTLGTVAVRAVVFGLILSSCNCDAHYIYGYVHGSEPEAFYIISAIAIGFIYGVILAVLHWIVLRKRIGTPRGWIAIGAVGASVGWALTTYFPGAFDSPVDFVLYPIAVSGAVMAVGQAWMLRESILPALWWVLAWLFPWGVLEYAGKFSELTGIQEIKIPLIILSAMLIASVAVYVFGQTGQRKINALALGGFSLVAILIWGLIART